MPAVGITDGPPTCARDHRAVVLSCPHPARRWAALECHSAWLVVDAQVLVCSRQIHSPSQWPHTHSASALTAALILGIAIPGSRDSRIPKSRDWAALNPRISGLTKFIYLTVFLVLFLKIILCIYSFFDAFLSPQWGGEEAVVLGPTCMFSSVSLLTELQTIL